MDKIINKKILVGVCSGIAAYKSAELVRLLRKKNADVRVVMTEAATHFVGPLTFQALSGHDVHTKILDETQENAMDHINLARWANTIVIAPASADMIAKLSHGLADDLLSTLILAAECDIFIAPAMNQAMWRKTVTQENCKRLQGYGYRFIGPADGEQACGETGAGRLTEPELICSLLLTESENYNLLHNKKVLVSAGPTREALDPVRYISNRSSGKMGYALARAARGAGADVTLVSGPVHLAAPADITVIQVESAQQMYEAIMPIAEQHDIYIGAAAVADYRAAQKETKKIKKAGEESSILLQRNPDIVASVAMLPKKPFVVGFAAETEELEQYARNKMRNKHLDMIAANWVDKEEGGFDSDLNALQVFWPGGNKRFPLTDKSQLAGQLLNLIIQQMHAKDTA